MLCYRPSAIGQLVTFSWIGCGVAAGIWLEGMTVIEAMEFAFSAVTTAGLKGFSANSNSLDAPGAIFCAVFCFIGVPLYMVWIGKCV